MFFTVNPYITRALNIFRLPLNHLHILFFILLLFLLFYIYLLSYREISWPHIGGKENVAAQCLSERINDLQLTHFSLFFQI